MPCEATDEKREQYLLCQTDRWLNRDSAGACQDCNKHWRKKLGVPEGLCVLGLNEKFQTETMAVLKDGLPPSPYLVEHCCCETPFEHFQSHPDSKVVVFLVRPIAPKAEKVITPPPAHESPAFFVVWRKDGSVPSKRHPTEDEARKEAHRLAEKEGVRFYVLKAVAAYQRGDVEVRELK